MKLHRSSELADSLSIDVEAYRAKYEHGAHVAIFEYQQQLALIEAIGWAEHTSDWDLFVVIELTNGQTIQAPYGYAEIEWGKKLYCLDLLDDIRTIQNRVIITVYKETVEGRLSMKLSEELDPEDNLRTIILKIDEISKIGLNY